MTAGATHQTIHPRCGDCPIRHRAVCADCDPDELTELDRIKTYRTFEAGQTIAWSGEPMPLIGSVVEGVAMLTSTLPDGRRQMVGLLFPSDFIGRPGRSRTAHDVIAATDVVLCMFRRAEFERFVSRSPHVESRMLQMTLDDLDAAREWMLLLGRKTAREKIASLFVIMARRDAALHTGLTGDGLHFPLYLTRESMADYLGLTIETVSRQISALRRAGVIELLDNRMVRVPDFSGLIDRSADDYDGGIVA